MSLDREALQVRELAWSALLGQWIEFAKASVALPEGGEGGRWKRAVPTIIQMQATVCLLRDLGSVAPEDRRWMRDRAELVWRRCATTLAEIWGNEPMPPHLIELESDAVVAQRDALYAGLEELVWSGPGLYEVPDFDPGPASGTLFVMQPGSLALPDEPVAFAVDRPLPQLPGLDLRRGDRPRQVYRELDSEGRFVGAVLAPLEGDLPAGLPMLIPISLDGAPIGRFTHERAAWSRLQRAAFAGRESLPSRVLE